MLKVGKFLPLSIVLLSLACGLVSQALPGTPTSIPTLPPPAAATNPSEITATLLPTPTISPTQIPTEVPSPTVDPLTATRRALMGSMGAITDISLYLHPIGNPLTSWRSVPIMSQATAGQEYPGNIYSYTAAATLDQARQFYQGKAQSLGFIMAPGSGYAGAGAIASHNVSFVSYPLTIYMTSYDNDTGHVTVVIAKVP